MKLTATHLSEVWMALRVEAQHPCGHTTNQVHFIAAATGEFSGEQMALKILEECEEGAEYIVAPFMLNALLPPAKLSDWPDSYRYVVGQGKIPHANRPTTPTASDES